MINADAMQFLPCPSLKYIGQIRIPTRVKKCNIDVAYDKVNTNALLIKHHQQE